MTGESLTGAAQYESDSMLPDGTWIVRLDYRHPRLVARNSDESGELVEASLGGVHAIFAGTLHSRSAWSQDLEVPETLTEAELLVRAYRRWGAGLLDRVRGVFAFGVWDRDAGTLLAARDPMGLYPFFYSEGPETLLFSNSIHALTRQKDVSSVVNLPALVDHLRHRWPYMDETFLEKVRRLPPGHALEQRIGQLRVWRYWDPLPPDTAVDWVKKEDLGHFDELLVQAVNRSAEDRRTGIFLSGGLDSVSIAAVATTEARNRGDDDVLALSLAFPVPEVNEEAVQRGVASALGMPQVILDWDAAVGEEGLIERGADLSATMPAPLLNLWMPAYDRLATEGKGSGCQVILTGAGGDEWLTVSPFYGADLIRRLDVRGLARLFADHNRSYNVSSLLYFRNVLWRFGARPLLATAVRSTLEKRAPSALRTARLRRLQRATAVWIAPDPALRDRLIEREVDAWEREAQQRHDSTRSDRRFPSFYTKEMRTALDHPLVAMEHEETFEQGRRLGLQFRQPYWDAELVTFLYRTPPELLNRDGWSKALVRDSVARRFPELGFEGQRKVTAVTFARSLILREGQRMWATLGGTSALEEAGIVDGRLVRKHLRAVAREPDGWGYGVLWDLLAFECWLRVHR